jgi:hypothetical protein
MKPGPGSHPAGPAVLLLAAIACYLIGDARAQEETNAANDQFPRWEGRYDPEIVQQAMRPETRPEALRRIILDWYGFRNSTWETDPSELQLNRDLFHQIFRHRSALPIRSPELSTNTNGLILSAVWWDAGGGPMRRDHVSQAERYPAVSDAGWEGVPTPGLDQDDVITWENFEPGGRNWDSTIRFFLRDDGAVRFLDSLVSRSRFPRTVWWGDVTGDSQLDLVQWRRHSFRSQTAYGRSESQDRWMLEFWRMGWDPELLGAVIVTGGQLGRSSLPIFEFVVAREDGKLRFEVPHRFGDEPGEGDARAEWWERQVPPFEWIVREMNDLWEKEPRAAMELLTRRNMPEDLAGHYHLLVEPETAADPWDAEGGWILHQEGRAARIDSMRQGLHSDDFEALGWHKEARRGRCDCPDCGKATLQVGAMRIPPLSGCISAPWIPLRPPGSDRRFGGSTSTGP